MKYLLSFCILFVWLTGVAVFGQSLCEDIEYAQADGISLKLDLHLPKQAHPPVIVYVHGGAWRAGSKADVPIVGLLDHGFAIASVDYRLSAQARFPAQVHDLKAAVRFLRAQASALKIDTRHIAVIGSSAGGHLAALVGVTNGHKKLEGTLGHHLDQSSDVQAIVSFYGASNLQSILSQSTAQGLKVRVPALQDLLGSLPDANPSLARLASPVIHVDAADPPLLLIHGDADPQMPVQQTQEMLKTYEEKHLTVQCLILPGSRHGGREFYDTERLERVAAFLKRSFSGAK